MPNLVVQGQTAALRSTLVLRRPYKITGLTRTSAGVLTSFCEVHLFKTSNDTQVDLQLSDVSGSYAVTCYDNQAYYIVATTTYTADTTSWTADSSLPTADATEMAGVTVNTLVGM